MLLGRARLLEHYQRVLREDMLTIFNRAAEMQSLECSIMLHGPQALSSEAKYRAAALLEILTGQRPKGQPAQVEHDDPAFLMATEAQKAELQKQRNQLIQQSLMRDKSKKQQPKNAPKTQLSVPTELRKAGSALKLITTLHGSRMYYFLEKLREYYLPDIVGLLENNKVEEGDLLTENRSAWKTPVRGHDNDHSRRGLLLHWQKWGGSKRDCYPPRYPIGQLENPEQAVTTYLLQSSDLLKFPDVELHFEALGPLLASRQNQDITGSTVNLIMRPTVQVTNSLNKATEAMVPPVDHVRMMNYLLSQYFNAYLTRPHVS